ncbi:MAG TPA: ABC transporter permease [Thermoanaerobaculia bacterium]|nr:ABC transporter permease [Thermoanaerobaculia bacterium]
MHDFLQDLRYGLRTLLRAPSFTAVAVVTPALGIGANTAIFSVVHAVLLRRLPYPDPDRLVVIAESQHVVGDMGVAWPDFLDMRERVRSMGPLALYRADDMTVAGQREPELLHVGEVSAEFFPLLGATPAAGRLLLSADDRPGAAPTVVLSDEMWRSRFGGDRGVIGRSLRLDAVPHTIVGVLPRGFSFFPKRVDLYRPIGLHGGDEVWLDRRNHSGARVLGRLAPGRALAEARTELDGVMRQLEAQYPESHSAETAKIRPLDDKMFEDVRAAAWTLLAAVGLVLLLACVNVAHLQLARGTARQKELAIRAALGAGRGRIVRQLLTESLCVSAVGGVLGLLLASWALGPIVRLAPDDIPRLAQTRIDPGVLLFTLALSIATGLLFGAAPALTASRPDPQAALSDGGRGSTGGRSRSRFRTLLFVSEVALAFVLVIGSGLLIRSLLSALAVAPGFRPEGTLALDVALPEAKYPDAGPRRQFYERAIAELRQLPGVEAASAIYCAPLVGRCWGSVYTLTDRALPPRGELPSAAWNVAEPSYFQTAGIPLREGRQFTEADGADAPKVIIVNESFARHWWPGRSAVGKRVSQGFPDHDPKVFEIVGVVDDTRQEALDIAPRDEAFIPWAQSPHPSMTFVLRTTLPPMSLAKPAVAAIQSVDPDQSVSRVMPMTGYLSESVASRRFTTTLLGLFGLLALVLASVGIYGVVSYGVAERRREIGIRTALGARPRDVLRMIVGGALRLAAAGMAVGAIAALALSRLLSSLLFGVGPSDPATYAGVVVLLSSVVLAACVIPARGALRVDPNSVLRD